MATTRDCTTRLVTFYIKDVRRNPETHDWDAYVIVGGEEHYIGSREYSWDAEALCDTYVHDQLMRRPPFDAAPDAESEASTSASSLPSASALRARSIALQSCRRFSTPPALIVPRAWGHAASWRCPGASPLDRTPRLGTRAHDALPLWMIVAPYGAAT